MLSRRLALVGAAFALAVPVTSAVAWAEDPVTCASYGPHGVCLIWSESPGGEGTGGGGGAGGGAGDGGLNIIVVDGRQCVPAGLTQPQPPMTFPIWGGHTDGAIYDCVAGTVAGRAGFVTTGVTLQYWSATAPVPPPDPAVLAREAVSEMALQAIRVGIAPSAEDGAVGLVGMPNWMWIDRPDQQTFGPITRTASTGGWSVTATARVASVSWDMGDGQIVTCRGAGTPYSPDAGRSSSPDCGHTYTAQGQYAVQATSHWVVTWAGIGRTGTIRLDLRESVPVTIGEVQVLRQ